MRKLPREWHVIVRGRDSTVTIVGWRGSSRFRSTVGFNWANFDADINSASTELNHNKTHAPKIVDIREMGLNQYLSRGCLNDLGIVGEQMCRG